MICDIYLIICYTVSIKWRESCLGSLWIGPKMAAQLWLCHMPEAQNSEWLQRGRERESCLLRGMTPFSYNVNVFVNVFVITVSGAALEEVDMVQYWWFYVVVGLVLGMNVGSMFGIKRGADIVGSLVAGVMDGINKAVTGEVGKSGPASGGD